jgi:hypothetical protein
MKKYKVRIEGKTPYMQHRMDDMKLEEWEKKRGVIIERDDVSKEDLLRAVFHSYKDENGFFIPSEHLIGAMINAGSLVKAKVGNSKKSMKNIVAGMFSIEEEKIYIPNNFEIDKRSAVNRNIKARVITIRPKWSQWSAEFTLLVDNDTITEETIKNIIQFAGDYVGIGSFRPQCNGRFGRFSLVTITSLSPDELRQIR